MKEAIEESKNQIDHFLQGLHLDSLTEDEKIVAVAQAVSNIPWGEGRTVEEVFEKGVGTCTGKHKVLQACFDKLGIRYEPVVCTFKWSEQGVTYPAHLQAILDEGEWEHGHNFVKLQNGTYLDITWDPALAAFGFKILPNDWTPDKNHIGVAHIIQTWEGASIDEMKQTLIASLGEETKARREKFLHGFIEWIDSIHENHDNDH